MNLLTAIRKFPSHNTNTETNRVGETSTYSRCADTVSMWSECQCHLELCIGWYPCGLRYCKGKGENKNQPMTYRCGINTCKKYYLFSYYVPQKQMCLWDE